MHINFPEVMDVRTLAKTLRLSQQTIKKKIRNGELAAYKEGGSWKISRHAILEWLSQQQNGGE